MVSQVIQQYEALVAQAEEVRAGRGANDRIVIQVGSATCENAAGATEVAEEFRKHIAAGGREDIVLRRTGCTGRCSREPIVAITSPDGIPVKYERVNREKVHEIFTRHVMAGEPVLEHVLDGPVEALARFEILHCGGPRCQQCGKTSTGDALEKLLLKYDIPPSEVRLLPASCFGACGGQANDRAHLLVRPDKVLYRVGCYEDIDEIVREHIQDGRVVRRLVVSGKTVGRKFFELYGDVAFFNRQTRVALRHNGVIDPESLDEYFHYRGFQALATVLDRADPRWVIDLISQAKLRGRGGGGYPTGRKWAMAADAVETTRYIICNADEGDPGAFMDRSMLESDPLNVIEGMLLGAYAVGAGQGFFYIRAEYPLAIQRIERAIEACRQRGLLGRDILGSGFDFDVEIRLGAGAFVCGEETALIKSIEGERGQPRIRPPYPTEKGLWGKPTVINNVETFASVTAVINYGAEWFRSIGTPQSGGTKVFALAGKVKHTGLVEVPMGTTLREVVHQLGGGVANDRKLKAIQTGGPAGGCIPASMIDLPVDFDSLTQAGSIMGSGGMIVLDEDDCMVDIAKFFVTFSQDESCGKCTPCREGTTRMLEILERITDGSGTLEDIDRLKRLASLVKRSSLCGLGRAAPNPILSTLNHYHDEYLAHVNDRRCPAKKCVALLHYEINDKCVGCTVCARNCPADCITGTRREAHAIDQDRCIKCGRCFEVCRFDAVVKE